MKYSKTQLKKDLRMVAVDCGMLYRRIEVKNAWRRIKKALKQPEKEFQSYNKPETSANSTLTTEDWLKIRLLMFKNG